MVKRDEVMFGIIFVDHIQVIDDLKIEISKDVRFVDIQTWKVYEYYDINEKSFTRQLGFFNPMFQYISTIDGSLVKRRSDLEGFHLRAMTEIGQNLVVPSSQTLRLEVQIKVSKSQKQILKFSFEPNNEQKYFFF